MAGLLDFLNTPQGLGLLSGVAGYAAGARRGTPVNNIGRGLVTGLSGYATANDQIKKDSEDALTKQYRQLQMDQIQRTLDQQKAQDTWKAGLPAVMAPKLTGTNDQGQQLADQQAAFGQEGAQSLADSAQYAGQNAPLGVNYGTDKQAVQDYLMQPASPYADKIIENKFVPKDPQYKTVGDNLVKIGSDGTANPVFAAPAKPLTPSGDFATFTMLKQQGQLPANIDYTTWHRGNSKAGATNVTNAPVFKQESAESKTVGEGFGKAYNDIQTAGLSAGSKLARYQRMSQLLDGVNTGKFTPAGTELAAWAQSAGLNVDPKLGNKQAAVSLSNEMALALRNPSGGAGMPGALSDKDREFLMGMVPGLSTSPEGRKQMLDTATKLAKRDREVAQIARTYRQKHGHIDEGFYNDLQAFSESHPLFPKSAPSSNKAPQGVDPALWQHMTPQERALWQ